MITQSTFVIPPEIEAGLRSGDLIQFGGIVRNQLGHIVKHLKEVPLPAADENALRQIATVVRNPRVLVPTLAVTAAAVSAAAYAAARRYRRTATPECFRRYNASLINYVTAVRTGRLDAAIVDQLISDFDDVEAYSTAEGRDLTLDFTTGQAAMLLQVVVGYTHQLAAENAIELGNLDDAESVGTAGTVTDLRRHLELQRKIFNDAA